MVVGLIIRLQNMMGVYRVFEVGEDGVSAEVAPLGDVGDRVKL